MQLQSLIENLGLTLVSGDGSQGLSDLTDDSRGVTPGGLFVARSTGGAEDERWRHYAEDAIRRGASAVIAPVVLDVPAGVSLVVPRDAATRIDQAFAGQLAARFFGEPAKRLKLIGITGTNGKTTVATLTQYLLNAAGAKCGLLGTVAIDDGSPDGPQTAELTTPGAIDLHRYFAAMVANSCEACAMEVSSHALDQGRVEGLEFAVAVFTNLTQDHLDYHGTMENYAAAKAKLVNYLAEAGSVVLNSEDTGLRLITWPRTEIDFITCGVGDERGHTDASAWPSQMHATGSHAEFRGAWGRFEAELPLTGAFNLMNALQALTAAHAVIPWGTRGWAKHLEDCPPVPGRLQAVSIESDYSLSVLVDYAHTPDALSTVLQTLRPLTHGRLICVFGCGGDRDRTKRSVMANAVAGVADSYWLTSDNPRTEDPQRILDDTSAGLSRKHKDNLVIEIDRAKAIESAIMNAQPADTVLIAGKGHEDYQILGTEKIHFDDREHAAAALKKWVAQHPDGKVGGAP